jgi:hypothetical protein
VNLTAEATKLVRLANALEDALINRNTPEAIGLAEECREVATDIDREITSRRLHVGL